MPLLSSFPAMFGGDPNIFGGINPFITVSGATFTGSIYANKGLEHDLDPASYGAKEWQFELLFDASKSSSLYTTGSGLQVSALQVLACIKI